LFVAVIDRKISSSQVILQSISSDDSMGAWDKIASYIDLYSERVVSNNCFQKLLYQEMGMNRKTELSDNIRNILMKNVSELSKIITEGIESGEFKKEIDIPLIIATLYGTKNYIVNMPLMSSQMLGYDIQDDKILEEKLKPRLKEFMKNLLKSYLLNEHDN